MKSVQVFVIVAENRSFRKAAEILNRSQSAVSTQVKILEERVGVPLLHRTTRQVELTAEGEQLLVHAQRAMAALDFGLHQIADSAEIKTGRVSIGCVPSIAATILPTILAGYRAKRPGIKLELHELDAGQLLKAIRQGIVHFGIGPELESFSDCEFEPITSEPIYALLPKSHWLAGRVSIKLEELIDLPLIIASSSASLRNALDALVSARGLQIVDSMEVNQVYTMLALSEVGLGVAIVPGTMVPKLSKVFQALPIIEPEFRRTICQIKLKGNAFSPAAQELINSIAKALRNEMGIG